MHEFEPGLVHKFTLICTQLENTNHELRLTDVHNEFTLYIPKKHLWLTYTNNQSTCTDTVESR